MELWRKCESRIKCWYENSRKALLIKGARQVGKTYTIRKTLKELKCDYLEINLIDSPDAISVLKQAKTVDELIMGLSTVSEKRLTRGKSVLFLDEVQLYPEIVTKIKFLVDEGSFRYILSGSLLGIELRGLQSAPVGYMSVFDMYPLDFEEFLQITGINNDIITGIKSCFEKRQPVMDAVNEKMMDLFTRYLVVGGMPDAVNVFAETGSLREVTDVHRDIAELYKLDFTKYEAEDKRLLITKAYELIPAELLKQNRRFPITDLKSGQKYERVAGTFFWLIESGVAIPAYNATRPDVPLKLNEKQSLFKLYMSDVGMLTSEYGMDTKRMLITKEKNINAGGLYENAVAQELRSKGYNQYYYNSNRLGELDFVIEYKGTSLPVEVKSGKDYTIHSALNNCVNNKEYGIEEAFVLSSHNVSRKGKILYLPIYMIMFMDRDTEDVVLNPIEF